MRLITESCKLHDVQLTTAALWENSLDFSDPSEVFQKLRQSFKHNTGEDCLIRTTGWELVTLSCDFALVSFSVCPWANCIIFGGFLIFQMRIILA